MKYQTTRTKLYKQYGKENINKLYYCDIQFLMRGVDPIAYTCDNYGWHSDIYDYKGVIFSTGYTPIGTDKRRDLIREYDKKAEALCNKYRWEDKLTELLEKNRQELINKLRGL